MISKTILIKDKLEPKKLLKIAAFDNSKAVTKPHRHNGYLELVFLSATSGRHVIDGNESPIKTPCILIIRKDSVHHWELATPIEGFVLLVKKSFVDLSLDLEIARMVDEISKLDTIYLKENGIIPTLLQLLEQEENKICQEGLFRSLLAKVLESIDKIEQPTSISNDLYVRFIELLNTDSKIINNVAYYANLLHTSPQNLTAACKKNINNTASQILATYIIKEAKRLIFYTNKSIAEIAFSLGFTDKSNFSKYFKRFTGFTPSEFKKQYD
ncbi:MAG: helix-turn-helix transcriptional regulator [Sphingobacterium sp.]|jgi:AraC-like DNA-binding protein|uniref:helix-turn-helix domain-containing protein n=1 Tax=Sphingobacterium sp. TaxID=341027 RepID=UPI0028267216|nr:helix-turn-helix transcriptional regulator [Sphingobacterium sp.]MDR0265439.1 helix-turn-helix transcriptional regulator [Sphingobacterium sp.]